ncbi:hypothetical protein RN001_003453 [Aquatica leii]|uniref:Uncharacterized protein n=1 Tax=Aquatica leii TaxID=1421715 RepID=A0AAN7Q9J9_9COLE|nr:hypothetical protein RN001_003453 [Aquatica leii]
MNTHSLSLLINFPDDNGSNKPTSDLATGNICCKSKAAAQKLHSQECLEDFCVNTRFKYHTLQNVLISSIRDKEIIENTDSSDPEPFEDSGDEYVPINESSDTDEGQEEQFENINLLPEEVYMSVSGNKTITAKQLKAACTCKQKCFQKITPEEIQSLFTDFYKFSSSGQNQFVANSIEEEGKQVQRLRRNDGKQSRRNFTRKYFLTKKRLKKARLIVENKRSSEGKICPEDRRGKHENHPKVSENDKLLIKEHINLFPAYHSHYSRSHTQKKYLSPDLSIAEMYRLYTSCIEKYLSRNSTYHKPKNDTLAKCDKFAIQLKCCQSEIERISIEKEKNIHLHLADSAYQSKRRDNEECQNNPGYVAISFDLQKCLPAPYLRSGMCFYNCQLWTFNLTIYQTIGKESSALCYLWNETVAGGGGQEIGSCIYHYLHNLSENNNDVPTYTESKNLIINHKFFEVGHTHMEADSIHAAIVKAKKRTTADIELPRDWANLIRFVPRKPPIIVIELEQKAFLNFKSWLNTYYVDWKKNTLNETMQWLQIKWMQYSTDNLNILYKHSFESQFKIFDISRRHTKTRQGNLLTLLPLNNELLPLSTEKLTD